MKKTILFALLASALACAKAPELPLIDAAGFATDSTALYTLRSEGGLVMQVTNFGGRIVSLFAPDREGKYADVVLGRRTLDEYVHHNGERYIGCVVGRYANRIAKGQFTLDDVTYQLPINNNGQTLHGGLMGLDMVNWQVDTVSNNGITLHYTAADGQDGFPGNLSIRMSYTLMPDNALVINYTASTDKSTVVNLSNHSFFNLKGEGGGTINDHMLQLLGSAITPVDSVLIPSGEFMPVEGTPFDFRTPTAIGERVDADDPQLAFGKGYDHNWVLDRKTFSEVELAATVYEPVSGRYMEVLTDQPGIQFYGGNFFNGSGKGKNGQPFNYREALALETQKFPDSPNHPGFPSTRLDPGQVYTQTCIYRFSVK